MEEDVGDLIQSMETMSDVSGGEVSVYSSADSPGDVVTFYRENAPGGGWKRTLALTSQEEGGIVIWEKGDWSAQMVTGVDNQTTLILLGCGPKLGSAAAPSVPTYTEEDGLAGNSVIDIVVTGEGSAWLATTSGLSHVAGGEWTTYDEDDGLPSKRLSAVVVDADGNPWVGTEFKGLGHFTGSAWETFEAPVTKVSSLATGPDGSLWVGSCDVSSGGVYHFDGESWTRYDEDHGLGHHCVREVAVAPDGAVWAAAAGGLAHFDGTAWTNYTAANGLANDDVNAVAVDETGEVWAGTEAGASRFDGQAWAAYTTDDGLLGPKVRAVAAGPDGSTWFATDGGVSCLREGAWHDYTEDKGLPSNTVIALFAAPDGKVWLGTAFDGVAVLKPTD